MNDARISFPALPEAVKASSGPDIDPISLLWAIWRGKLLLAAFAIVGFGYGYHRAYIESVPTFQATTSVAILNNRESRGDRLSAGFGELQTSQTALNTELLVLKSMALLRKVVQELDLTSDPEFNPYLRVPREGPTIQNIKSYLARLIREPSPKGPPPSPELAETWAAGILSSKVTANLVPRTYVLQISAITTDAELSTKIANTLADLYILNQIEVKFEATEQATTWLSDRASELQTELEASEAEIKEFRANSNLINVENLEGLNRQLKDLRERALEAASVVETQQVRVTTLKAAQEGGDPVEMARVAADPTLNRVLTLLQADPNQDQTTFEARYGQILARADLELERTKTQKELLEQSFVDLETSISEQSADLVTLQQLMREAEASRLIYEFYLNRLKETSVQQGIQRADSRMLSAASGGWQVAPNRRQIILQAVLVAVVLGAALLSFRELIQNVFRSPQELEAQTGLTVIGQVPQIPLKQRKNVLNYLVEKPTSAAAEAIRNMRTSILMSNVDNPPQVIMVTSSVPGEGKTTLSLALTQNLSGVSKRVLLIEGDIRRRVFSEYFDEKRTEGLLSILSGKNTLADMVIHRPELGADILLGEKSKVNAADIFASDKFVDFINEARTHYDYVVIDTPPVLVVPDARVIGRIVDSIVYGVKWDKTSRRQVAEGLKSLESVGLKITGVVLSQISPKGMKRYGYGDTYGAYSRYGKNYYDI